MLEAVATTERAPPRAGLWTDGWVRVRRNLATLVAGACLVLIVLVAIVGPGLSRYALDYVDWSQGALATPPALAHGHWFGTDANGRDLFVRVWIGTRVSLLVALLATIVSVVIGVAWGATAGYLGGRIDG